MTTLADILTTIISKSGFVRLIENRNQSIGTTDKDITYLIVFTKADGYISYDTARIYVKDFGLPPESATWVGLPPQFVLPYSVSAFETALAAKKTAIMGANSSIKKIATLELNIVNSFAVVAAYIADAATPTKITKTLYFVYDDAGTLKFYPYVG